MTNKITKDQATPRPWKVNQPMNMGIYQISSENGKSLICHLPEDLESCDEAEANAALIVRAVNEYDGLVAEKALKSAVIAKLQTEKDELVEALKKAKEILYAYETSPQGLRLERHQADYINEIEKALAKAGAA